MQRVFLFKCLSSHFFLLISNAEKTILQVPEKPKRQLAAIMFIDIVGYTALMHENEFAVAKVHLRHREIFEQEHQKFNGEILQYYGDGTLSNYF